MTLQEKRDALIALIKMMPDEVLGDVGLALGKIMQRLHTMKLKCYETKPINIQNDAFRKEIFNK